MKRKERRELHSPPFQITYKKKGRNVITTYKGRKLKMKI